MTNCWPWFSAKYRAIEAQPWAKTVLSSGGTAKANGDIGIAPETMRAAAEAKLAQVAPQALAMLGGRLSLEVYTFARYMASEALGNSSTIEERVAVGEALRNRAKMGKTVYQLLMPSGFYGPIHAPDAYCQSIGKDCTGKHNVCCAPFNRWAATTRDPNVLTVLLAALVVSGASDNFARGADNQAAVNSTAWVDVLSTKERGYEYWVGPLPGVDHRRTFLVRSLNIAERATVGPQMLAAGRAAIGKAPAPWPPMSQTCSPTIGGMSGAEIVIGLLGLAAGVAGAMYFNRWLAGGIGLGTRS